MLFKTNHNFREENLEDQSESDNDSTCRQYEEIKNIKKQMQQERNQPYKMNDQEMQVHMQIAKSLRRIEKSKRAFERDQDGINSYGIKRQIEIENRKRQELLHLQMNKDSYQDGLPRSRMTQGSRFKTIQKQPNETIMNENMATALYKQIVQLPLQMQYLNNKKPINVATMSEEELIHFQQSLQRQKNYSKFQDDLQKKVMILKTQQAQPLTGAQQLSQATRIHYSAVNPYKDLQSIIQKDKFQVAQMSSKKTTGYQFGLSVEKILDQPQQPQKSEVILQNNEAGAKNSRLKQTRNGQLISQGSLSHRSKETLGSSPGGDELTDPAEKMRKIFRIKSQTVLNVIKDRKKLSREQADQQILEFKVKRKQKLQLKRIISNMNNNVPLSSSRLSYQRQPDEISRNPSAQQLYTARDEVKQRLELDGKSKNLYVKPQALMNSIEPLPRFKLIRQQHGSQNNINQNNPTTEKEQRVSSAIQANLDITQNSLIRQASDALGTYNSNQKTVSKLNGFSNATVTGTYSNFKNQGPIFQTSENATLLPKQGQTQRQAPFPDEIFAKQFSQNNIF